MTSSKYRKLVYLSDTNSTVRRARGAVSSIFLGVLIEIKYGVLLSHWSVIIPSGNISPWTL